jgi:hypothetical protein
MIYKMSEVGFDGSAMYYIEVTPLSDTSFKEEAELVQKMLMYSMKTAIRSEYPTCVFHDDPLYFHISTEKEFDPCFFSKLEKELNGIHKGPSGNSYQVKAQIAFI